MGGGPLRSKSRPISSVFGSWASLILLPREPSLAPATVCRMDAVTKAARRAQIAKDVAAARRDQQGVALSKLEIVEKLNELPAFAIVGADKSFVPLQVQDAAGETTVHDVAVIWTEPQEAQAALAQARAQRPDAAIGTLPLGKAFALCEGWAQAAGASRFRLQAHSKVRAELRPMLVRQLQQQGLPTGQVPFFFFAAHTPAMHCLQPVPTSAIGVPAFPVRGAFDRRVHADIPFARRDGGDVGGGYAAVWRAAQSARQAHGARPALARGAHAARRDSGLVGGQVCGYGPRVRNGRGGPAARDGEAAATGVNSGPLPPMFFSLLSSFHRETPEKRNKPATTQSAKEGWHAVNR